MLKPNYPSKILLLGEYTIIQNSAALAVPYFHYQSHWSDQQAIPESFSNTIGLSFSQKSLQKILVDLKQLKHPILKISTLEKDLNNGLWLCSNSPMGYGLGSSGVVCAAIYDRYAVEKKKGLQILKQELALLEHSFHGKSSGIDPLVAYTQLPLWIHTDKSIHSIKLPAYNQGTIFLVDTQQPRISTPLIKLFLSKCQEVDFLEQFVAPISNAVNQAINALIEADFASLMEAIGVISKLQWIHLPPMIPTQVHDLWKRGLSSNDFYLKICGAGGGGFMLGFAKDWKKIAHHFEGITVLHL